MGFELNKSYNGFELIKKEEIAELKSLCLLFEHEGTGAELMVLENEDDNNYGKPPGNAV